jgi:hypothetical protein
MLSTAASIIWLLFPILVWAFRKHLPGVGKHIAPLFLATVVVGSLLYVVAAWLDGAELEHAIYKFDLDGDRDFSDSELTPAAREAMRRFTTDTGRTFAPIVAGPATLVWVTFWFLLLAAVSWAITKYWGQTKQNRIPGSN